MALMADPASNFKATVRLRKPIEDAWDKRGTDGNNTCKYLKTQFLHRL